MDFKSLKGIKVKETKIVKHKEYTCKRCGSSQISVEESASYECFGCGYRFNMTYKVGDRVRVRDDLIDGREYGANTYVEARMREALGRVVTITDVSYGGQYSITAPYNGGCSWTNEMFVGREY